MGVIYVNKYAGKEDLCNIVEWSLHFAKAPFGGAIDVTILAIDT